MPKQPAQPPDVGGVSIHLCGPLNPQGRIALKDIVVFLQVAHDIGSDGSLTYRPDMGPSTTPDGGPRTPAGCCDNA
jgi:hypothetical protein